MDPTNELFLCLWEVVEDTAQDNKKIETAERLLKVFEDFGAEPEILMELAVEDKFLKSAVEIAYDEYLEHDEEGTIIE